MGRILHCGKEKENLYREVLEVQLAMGWPGLTREVQEICKTVGLRNVTKKYLTREEVIEYIQYHDMKCAKEKMQPLEKCRVKKQRLQVC